MLTDPHPFLDTDTNRINYNVADNDFARLFVAEFEMPRGVKTANDEPCPSQ